MIAPDPVPVGRFRGDLEALNGEVPQRIGVAVSGGPDSLALLLLAHAAYPGRIEAATVDHGLRPESAGEAAFVAELCGRLGVPHATLAAQTPIEGNVQAVARTLRYMLLGRWADKVRAGCLLTAHHLDDQAETLVMRLLRGSGLSGLAGIRARATGLLNISGVPVLRPLLTWRHEQLAGIVRGCAIDPVSDPSNRDERFDRARIRRLLADSQWLDPLAIARSAGALAEAEEAIQWTVGGLWRDRVAGDGERFTLDPADLPAELRRRLVLEIFAVMDRTVPRGRDIARLLDTLAGGGIATLAGIKCTGGPVWSFELAPPRRGA